MFKQNPLKRTDGYKICHPRMLAPGTTKLYGQWIPRSVKYAPKGVTKILSFGHQMTWKWIHDEFFEYFFSLPIQEAVGKVAKDFTLYLGMEYDASHFEALHNLGYLPIRVKALPEGIETKPNIPHMTFINTVNGFAWLPLYLETIISKLAWKPSTSATTALAYKRLIKLWLEKTDPDAMGLLEYLAHDFSSRGLDVWSCVSSGLGHASSFRGSDTLDVIDAARYFYGESEDEVVINSVNASEHSVSTTCIFTMGEKEMLKYFMKQFPKGILSVVADTFDLWTLITKYLPEIKEEILARDGKIVIRPDSGDPVDIICGWDTRTANYSSYPGTSTPRTCKHPAEVEGVIETLWNIFGGTINKQGYKVLDSHIGAIYGDSITLERAEQIYERLEAKGFASSNIVFGVGSFTYQYNTRDTFGFAAKGGWFETKEEYPDHTDTKSFAIYKDPITDDGTKKSPKGLLRVDLVDGEYVLKQECTPEEESGGVLQVIYEDGKFFNTITLTQIRELINKNV